MKKFINDNMVLFMLLAVIVAAVALFFSLKNRKKLSLLPEEGSEFYNALKTTTEVAGKAPAENPSSNSSAA